MAHRQVLDGRHQAWRTAHAHPTQPRRPVGFPSLSVPSTAAQAPRDPMHRPHQAVSAADGHSGLSAVLGQRVQARAGTATQNHGCGRGAGQCIVGLGSGRTKQWLVHEANIVGGKIPARWAVWAAALLRRSPSTVLVCERVLPSGRVRDSCLAAASMRRSLQGGVGRRRPAKRRGVSVQAAAVAGWAPRHPPDCPHSLHPTAGEQGRGARGPGRPGASPTLSSSPLRQPLGARGATGGGLGGQLTAGHALPHGPAAPLLANARQGRAGAAGGLHSARSPP